MTSFRRWTRPLIAIWPLLVALIAVATVGHDVAMAAQTHDGPSASSISTSANSGRHETPTTAAEHGALQPTTDPACPPDTCPELLDCGIARVTNPIPTPDHPSITCTPAVHVVDLDPAAGPVPPASSIPPVQPPGVRRALLQVYLN